MNGQEEAKILREKETREFMEQRKRMGGMSERDKYVKEVKKAAKKARRKGYAEYIIRVDLNKSTDKGEFDRMIDWICENTMKRKLWDVVQTAKGLKWEEHLSWQIDRMG